MLSKLAVRRLNKLADFMDALPKSKWKGFDMDECDFGKCGTAACAVGWGERVPGWKKNGYSFYTSPKFFDISADGINSDWSQLFSRGDVMKCKTPKQWARHCRKFIKANT